MGCRRLAGRAVRLGLVGALSIGIPVLAARADSTQMPANPTQTGIGSGASTAGDSSPISGPAILVLLAIWVAALALPRR